MQRQLRQRLPTPATVHVAPSFMAGIRKPICKSKVTSIDPGEIGL
jgi:hypothetical protein